MTRLRKMSSVMTISDRLIIAVGLTLIATGQLLRILGH